MIHKHSFIFRFVNKNIHHSRIQNINDFDHLKLEHCGLFPFHNPKQIHRIYHNKHTRPVSCSLESITDTKI